VNKDLIELAKACPDLIVQVRLGDLLEANRQLIAEVKQELEQQIADSKAETYITREKVMEITGKSAVTIWRWQKDKYLVPASTVGGTYRYRMSDVRRIMEGDSSQNGDAA
jgi:DNA-binding transcriptional MerR regulator